MTNKAITLSRELAQETATLIIRDICEYEPDDNPESLCITVKALELILLQRLEDAALAEPVPPAGGEPEMAELGLPLAILREALTATDSAVRLANMDAGAVITKAYGEFKRVREYVTRLQAEVGRLQSESFEELYNAVIDERDALQSELTKARELLIDHQFEYLPHSRRGVNGAGYYCVQCGERKDNGCAPSCELEAIVSSQSAPADKGQDDCAHSEANKHGCPECGEEFKRAEKGRGEPVLQWSDDGLTWMDGNENEMVSARCAGWKTRTLYRHPPVPEDRKLPTEDESHEH